jgi:hypothetical protein
MRSISLTNSDRLQEIRERAEKATPGPWKAEFGGVYPPESAARLESDLAGMAFLWPLPGGNEEDAEFIAASRADVPYLLQLVTEQQNEIAWLRTWIFRLHDPETAAQKILKLTEEPMTIEQIRDYLGIEAKGYRKQERPI